MLTIEGEICTMVISSEGYFGLLIILSDGRISRSGSKRDGTARVMQRIMTANEFDSWV